MTSTMFLSLLAFAAVAWMGFLVYAGATGMIGYAISKRCVDPIDYDEMQRELDEAFGPSSIQRAASHQ